MALTMADVHAMIRQVPPGRGARILLEQPAAPRPTAPQEDGLAADLLPKLKQVAQAQGWKGMYTYNALGPDAGLQCLLVRDTVIYADLKDVGEPLTVMQQAWQAALRAAGQEVYTWTMADWNTIQARLSRLRY